MMMNASMNICTFAYKPLCRHFFISFGYIPKSGISDSYGKFMFNILRNCQTILQSAIPFDTPTNNVCSISPSFLFVFRRQYKRI